MKDFQVQNQDQNFLNDSSMELDINGVFLNEQFYDETSALNSDLNFEESKELFPKEECLNNNGEALNSPNFNLNEENDQFTDKKMILNNSEECRELKTKIDEEFQNYYSKTGDDKSLEFNSHMSKLNYLIQKMKSDKDKLKQLQSDLQECENFKKDIRKIMNLQDTDDIISKLQAFIEKCETFHNKSNYDNTNSDCEDQIQEQDLHEDTELKNWKSEINKLQDEIFKLKFELIDCRSLKRNISQLMDLKETDNLYFKINEIWIEYTELKIKKEEYLRKKGEFETLKTNILGIMNLKESDDILSNIKKMRDQLKNIAQKNSEETQNNCEVLTKKFFQKINQFIRLYFDFDNLESNFDTILSEVEKSIKNSVKTFNTMKSLESDIKTKDITLQNYFEKCKELQILLGLDENVVSFDKILSNIENLKRNESEVLDFLNKVNNLLEIRDFNTVKNNFYFIIYKIKQIFEIIGKKSDLEKDILESINCDENGDILASVQDLWKYYTELRIEIDEQLKEQTIPLKDEIDEKEINVSYLNKLKYLIQLLKENNKLNSEIKMFLNDQNITSESDIEMQSLPVADEEIIDVDENIIDIQLVNAYRKKDFSYKKKDKENLAERINQSLEANVKRLMNAIIKKDEHILKLIEEKNIETQPSTIREFQTPKKHQRAKKNKYGFASHLLQSKKGILTSARVKKENSQECSHESKERELAAKEIELQNLRSKLNTREDSLNKKEEQLEFTEVEIETKRKKLQHEQTDFKRKEKDLKLEQENIQKKIVELETLQHQQINLQNQKLEHILESDLPHISEEVKNLKKSINSLSALFRNFFIKYFELYYQQLSSHEPINFDQEISELQRVRESLQNESPYIFQVISIYIESLFKTLSDSNVTRIIYDVNNEQQFLNQYLEECKEFMKKTINNNALNLHDSIRNILCYYNKSLPKDREITTNQINLLCKIFDTLFIVFEEKDLSKLHNSIHLLKIKVHRNFHVTKSVYNNKPYSSFIQWLIHTTNVQ